jgi:hypothetical protein
MKINNAKKSQEKTEKVNVENLSNEGAEYKKKSESVPERLKDLW